MADAPLTSNQKVAPARDFSVWSFLRAVLEQGAAIHLDYRDRPYEEHSARLDEAAREREKQLMEGLRPTDETTAEQGMPCESTQESRAEPVKEGGRWHHPNCCIFDPMPKCTCGASRIAENGDGCQP